ncbi:MAG: hypothetical protein ACYTDU_02060 [Planctomycetota bacterium]|jgi:hypothetical protein
MYRILRRYHRDLAALMYLLLVYPVFTSETTYGRHPPTAVLALFLAISLGGLSGNWLMLRGLDRKIREQKLQRLVELPFFRFLAALVVLPFWPVFAIGGLVEGFIDSAWMPVVFVFLAGVNGTMLSRYGRGRSNAVSPRWLTIVGTIQLLLFELTIYTVLLEGFPMAERNFHVSLASLPLLVVPMTGLFVLLFLPSFLAFHVEECVHRRSKGRAFLSLWARFILTRYLPVFLHFYLRGPG